MFGQKKQEKNAAGLVFFLFFSTKSIAWRFFFMGFINDFQMGAVNHFMHCHLLTTSYTLVNVFQFWEPQNCISYHKELKLGNVCCFEKFSSQVLRDNIKGKRFWRFQDYLCRLQSSDLSGIICYLLNYLYLLKSFLFTHEFA